MYKHTYKNTYMYVHCFKVSEAHKCITLRLHYQLGMAPACSLGLGDYYKLTFKLDKNCNSVALVQSKCPGRPITML